MKQALWHLLNDFLSAILFLIVYAVSGSVRIAACIAVAAGVAQGQIPVIAGAGSNSTRPMSM